MLTLILSSTSCSSSHRQTTRVGDRSSGRARFSSGVVGVSLASIAGCRPVPAAGRVVRGTVVAAGGSVVAVFAGRCAGSSVVAVLAVVPDLDVDSFGHGAGELRLHRLGPSGALRPQPAPSPFVHERGHERHGRAGSSRRRCLSRTVRMPWPSREHLLANPSR